MNDLPVGRSVDETLRLVQAFQYTDKHGEGTVDTCDAEGKCMHKSILLWGEKLQLTEVFRVF